LLVPPDSNSRDPTAILGACMFEHAVEGSFGDVADPSGDGYQIHTCKKVSQGRAGVFPFEVFAAACPVQANALSVGDGLIGHIDAHDLYGMRAAVFAVERAVGYRELVG